MFRALVACVLACGSALPAMADERDAPVIEPAALNLLLRDTAPSYGRRPLPILAAAPARLDAKPLPFTLPAYSARLEARPLLMAVALSGEELPATYFLDAPVALSVPPSDLSETTSSRGGSYAVRDILRAQTKPRKRGSPLAAALVLRIDGEEDSEPFSLGGGAVASAIWRVMPRQ